MAPSRSGGFSRILILAFSAPCSWLILLEKLIWVGFVEGGNRYSEITDVLFGTFDFDSATRSPVGNERAQVQGDNRGTISRRNASLVGSAGR